MSEDNLDRKYPQETSWTYSSMPDGGLRFTAAGWLVRIMPPMVFDKPSFLDVWYHIEEYWDLDRTALARERARLGVSDNNNGGNSSNEILD